ncbi:MAG: hypothetical protein WCR61_00240 [Bacteroidales bacterium]
MDTILYIVIAVAIMAYQIYNEKKKKEKEQGLKKEAVNEPSVARLDPNEELEKDLASMFKPITSEDEKLKPKIDPEPTLDSQAYNVDITTNKTDAENKQLLNDIYESSQITNFDSSDKDNKELEIQDEEFNPRLFILYSEIARPKFMD